MTTRRTFVAAALMAQLAPLRSAVAQAPKTDENVTLLFVQSAKGMAYQNGRLTLKSLSLATVYFSDRPKRLAGHMDTKEFVPFWSEGKNSFLKDPPNATVSIFTASGVKNVVVVLRDPVLKGEDLTYEAKVLEGDMPASDGLVSVFIDIIGMPLTPISYAGAARRRMYFELSQLRHNMNKVPHYEPTGDEVFEQAS